MLALLYFVAEKVELLNVFGVAVGEFFEFHYLLIVSRTVLIYYQCEKVK